MTILYPSKFSSQCFAACMILILWDNGNQFIYKNNTYYYLDIMCGTVVLITFIYITLDVYFFHNKYKKKKNFLCARFVHCAFIYTPQTLCFVTFCLYVSDICFCTHIRNNENVINSLFCCLYLDLHKLFHTNWKTKKKNRLFLN